MKKIIIVIAASLLAFAVITKEEIVGWLSVVAALLGIIAFFSPPQNIVTKKQKEIDEKDRQIKELRELREHDRNEIERLKREKESLEFRSLDNEHAQEIAGLKSQLRQKERDLNAKEEKILQLLQEKAALERELEAAKKIIAENEERGIARQSDLFKKAYRSLLKGDIEEALNQLSVEELEKRKDVDLWTLRAEILFFIKKDFNQTIQCYKKIIELNPDYAAAYNNMGITYQDSGDLKTAIACFEKAIELKPDGAAAYGNMGNVYSDSGDLKTAIACYEKVLELNPDYAAAYNNMGIAYQYLGNPEAANACFQKASMIRNKQSFTEDQ